MWQQLLGSMLTSGGMGQGGGQSQAPLPGQEARNMDLSGLIQAMGQPQPQSGAIGIPQQQAQSGMVLPPKPSGQEFGTTGMPPSLDAALAGMQDPTTMNVNPAQQSMPINGQVQRQPASQGATGVPNPGQAGGMGQGIDWGSLLNPVGTRDAPNALVRMGEGYNSGGLIGALGYLLTDMSRQANGTTNQTF